jgi:hypothetical protein
MPRKTPDALPRLERALAALCPVTADVERVLSVGCGLFPCAGVLRRLFPKAVLFGIDRDWSVLRKADGSVIIAADGAAIPFARWLCFDLILIRHPDVDRHPAGWRQVCTALPGWLSDRGRLLLTCYTAHELAAREALLAGGAQPVALLCDLAPVDLAGNDRFLLGMKA